MKHFIIDTAAKLKKKLDMVQDLGDIEIATRLLEDKDTNTIDTNYTKLNCQLTPIETDVTLPTTIE